MQSFKKVYKTIFIIGICAIIISISYAITYYMPDYLGIEGWYSLLNNISISYIAALIFFVLQVYIPEYRSAKKAEAVMNPLFLDLSAYIEETIAICRTFMRINEGGKITVDWKNANDKVIYYVPELEGTTGSGNLVATRKTEKDLIAAGKIYSAKIEKIKDRIEFKNCNPDIIDAISELDSSNFFSTTFPIAILAAGTMFGFPDFQKLVNSMEQVNNKFKAACNISQKHKVRAANDEEIVVCETFFCREAWRSQTVEDFNQALLKEKLRQHLKTIIDDENEINRLLDGVLPLENDD